MIYINESEVKELLNWHDTYKAVENAMKSVSIKNAVQEARTFTGTQTNNTFLLTMPGYLNDPQYGALACKLVTHNENNPKLPVPLPTINANIVLFDETTGILKAVIAGTEITTYRTAAASVVATQHLLRNNLKERKILAILGAGVQGRAHAEAFSHFFHFDQIRIWNHNALKASHLVQELNSNVENKAAVGLFKFFGNVEECVMDADIIITATSAAEPIVKFEWVKIGAHINGIITKLTVGANPKNHFSELDHKIYLNADIYIDNWTGAKKELAGLENMGVRFKGEIGNVITGDLLTRPNRMSVFQSLGMAVEDCAMARMVYDLYLQRKERESQYK